MFEKIKFPGFRPCHVSNEKLDVSHTIIRSFFRRGHYGCTVTQLLKEVRTVMQLLKRARRETITVMRTEFRFIPDW